MPACFDTYRSVFRPMKHQRGHRKTRQKGPDIHVSHCFKHSPNAARARRGSQQPCPPCLGPPELASGIDALNAEIYPAVNNGVYRAGFATTQAAYEKAYQDLFAMLDRLERRPDGSPIRMTDDGFGS